MTTLRLNVRFTTLDLVYKVFFMKILCSRGDGSWPFPDANDLISVFKSTCMGVSFVVSTVSTLSVCMVGQSVSTTKSSDKVLIGSKYFWSRLEDFSFLTYTI